MKTATDSKIHLFTLIELLVVIAIIAILASMLLPALNRARNNAQAAACMGNMKQHATAILSYAGTYNDYLPTAQIKDYGDGGWSVQLVDFLGIKTTLKDSRTGLPSVRDSQMARGVFRCPAFREETALLVGGSLPPPVTTIRAPYTGLSVMERIIFTPRNIINLQKSNLLL